MIRLSKKEKALMDMLRNFEIDLNYVAYVFTITGGGWGSYHELYIITNDRKVLYLILFVLKCVDNGGFCR